MAGEKTFTSIVCRAHVIGRARQTTLAETGGVELDPQARCFKLDAGAIRKAGEYGIHRLQQPLLPCQLVTVLNFEQRKGGSAALGDGHRSYGGRAFGRSHITGEVTAGSGVNGRGTLLLCVRCGRVLLLMFGCWDIRGVASIHVPRLGLRGSFEQK